MHHLNLYKEVRDGEVNDIEKVYTYWENLTEIISKDFGNILSRNIFRIGISQKMISLFLKYLYCHGIISKLCICPIDGIVKQEILKAKNEPVELENWTEITHINALKEYVNILKDVAKNKRSVIDWEIEIWNKNAIKI